jgi:UDP-glucose 4-epimerase
VCLVLTTGLVFGLTRAAWVASFAVGWLSPLRLELNRPRLRVLLAGGAAAAELLLGSDLVLRLGALERTGLYDRLAVINECVRHDVRTLVFTSSIAVYGRHQTPMTEDMVPAPEDPYGIAKYAVELDLRAAHETFGLDYVVFRPHNVYGERQNIADRYRNVVGIFMSQVMQGQPMTIFGDGHQTRAFSYIDDVAPLIAAAPLVPAARNQTFNVGADTPCSVLELAAEVASAFGVPRRIVHLPPRSEVTHAFCDHARLRAAFDPPPPTTLRDGIQRMASWARTCRLVPTTVGAEIEVDKNLPASWRT